MRLLCADQWATYFIYRDPRDVVVSHVYYITELAPHHIYHRYFQEVLPDMHARLRASIQGIRAGELTHLPAYQKTLERSYASPEEFILPNIQQRFEPYLEWLKQPEICLLRYEDLISKPAQAIEAILEHAMQRGFKLFFPKDEAIRRIMESLDPAKSPTFRAGKSGEWRELFTEEHKTLFKSVANDLLLLLGYEQDASW